MAKVITAHADFARVTVQVNGVPISMYAEVDVTLKRPAKVDVSSKAAWNLVTGQTVELVSAELIPAVV